MGAPFLHFEVVTPEGRLYQDESVAQVVLPAQRGLLGVLPQHAPTVSVLLSGVIDIYHGPRVAERIFIGGGFAHINEASCTVMATEGILVSDINKEDVQFYITRVRAEIEEAREEDEREMLQRTLMIARAKLDLLETLSRSPRA